MSSTSAPISPDAHGFTAADYYPAAITLRPRLNAQRDREWSREKSVHASWSPWIGGVWAFATIACWVFTYVVSTTRFQQCLSTLSFSLLLVLAYSLREMACRRAGVSTAEPYRHFIKWLLIVVAVSICSYWVTPFDFLGASLNHAGVPSE